MVAWFRRRVGLVGLAPLLITLAACAAQPCASGSASAATAPVAAAAPVATAPGPASGGSAQADGPGSAAGSEGGAAAEPGEDPGSTALPVALPPVPQGAPQTVVYEVFSTDSIAPTPIYVDSDGKSYQQFSVTTPWSRTVKMSDLVTSYSVRADNDGSKGFTACRISVNGVVKAQKYIDGPHSTKGVNNRADCRWPN